VAEAARGERAGSPNFDTQYCHSFRLIESFIVTHDTGGSQDFTQRSGMPTRVLAHVEGGGVQTKGGYVCADIAEQAIGN